MSVFSEVPTYEWLDDNEFAFAIRSPQPISPGHALVVSKREVPTWFDATHAERLAVLDLIDKVKHLLDGREPRPDGYSVGFEAGEAAGQAVMHLHVHVIPRRSGDAGEETRQVVPNAPPPFEPPASPAMSVPSPALEPRVLPSLALERARELITSYLSRSGGGGMLQLPGGRRAKVLGPALDGGVRIVGPDTGFVELTIAELDVAWVIAAEDERAGSAPASGTSWPTALVRAAQA